MSTAAHRIVRSKRLFLRASEILDRDADALKDSYTVGGEWELRSTNEAQAKEDHDEMKRIAAELRLMGGKP